MGVFSYLNLKRPANFIWKTFSPGRDLGEDKDGDSQRTLNSSSGDVSLVSTGPVEVALEEPVTLKDRGSGVAEDRRDWLVSREEGGQERLVGGRGNFNFVSLRAG